MSERVLIIGGSGFIGQTLYKELHPYFDVYGTYAFNTTPYFLESKVFYKYEAQKDDLESLLYLIKPTIIISCFEADQMAYKKAHQTIIDFVALAPCKLIYISSVVVFDGLLKHPAIEKTTCKANSSKGLINIANEKNISQLQQEKYLIVRLPILLGYHSVIIQQFINQVKANLPVEVFPNVIISANTQQHFATQLHYLINKAYSGIIHLTSEDVIHHEDLFKEIAIKLELPQVVFKQVYQSNEERYLALLNENPKLPKHKQIDIAQVIEQSSLNFNLITLNK